MLLHFWDLNDRTLPDHLHDQVHEDYDISECTMVKSYRFARYLQHFNKLQAECKKQTARLVERSTVATPPGFHRPTNRRHATQQKEKPHSRHAPHRRLVLIWD
ncbi:hypothetical protein TNCV_2822811 [Trichonephila clavipes]|nr:hypothetical protein TNCV_2822811 [Trichonephila clavipes]